VKKGHENCLSLENPHYSIKKTEKTYLPPVYRRSSFHTQPSSLANDAILLPHLLIYCVYLEILMRQLTLCYAPYCISSLSYVGLMKTAIANTMTEFFCNS